MTLLTRLLDNSTKIDLTFNKHIVQSKKKTARDKLTVFDDNGANKHISMPQLDILGEDIPLQ